MATACELTSQLRGQGGYPLVGLGPDILDLALEFGTVVLHLAVLARMI